jgi:hypothetical protein
VSSPAFTSSAFDLSADFPSDVELDSEDDFELPFDEACAAPAAGLAPPTSLPETTKPLDSPESGRKKPELETVLSISLLSCEW